jgi:hypothetical protein
MNLSTCFNRVGHIGAALSCEMALNFKNRHAKTKGLITCVLVMPYIIAAVRFSGRTKQF